MKKKFKTIRVLWKDMPFVEKAKFFGEWGLGIMLFIYMQAACVKYFVENSLIIKALCVIGSYLLIKVGLDGVRIFKSNWKEAHEKGILIQKKIR